jgi:alkylation response protein AidB-like acyl-CoA dehydrogenase
MDFQWPEPLAALADEARRVGEAGASGREVREDAWVVAFDREFSLELGRRGWLGMTWPIEHGGHGRSALERFVVTEALITVGAPLGATWVGDRQIGPSLLAFGTPEQRRRLLPDLVAGRVTWCLGLSEPDAGSDLVSVRTRATRDGDSWVLDGAKVWTSSGAEAEWCYLVARTNPDVPPHAGLSEFVVDMATPGVHVRTIRDMTGDEHFCETVFDGARIPADCLVGQEDGSWRQLMRQLEHERGGVDRLVSNRALFDLAVARADHGDPVVRQEIAALESSFRIGRLLVIREAIGQAPSSFSAATKVFCTEHEQRVAHFATRTFGAASLLAGRVSRAICYAPAYTIQGGTSDILRNVIGERVLRLPREPSGAGVALRSDS